jgi:hypothetical protein
MLAISDGLVWHGRDSMVTCHAETLRYHDQRVLHASGLLRQMTFITITDPATGAIVAAKLIADQAYARGANIEPKMGGAALAALGPVAAAIRRAYDLANA